MSQIDLNCDMGESFGPYQYGADREIMPFISSANIACGFHAGDPHVIRKTVRLAAEYGIQVGAHVGFPDRQGFGRRNLDASEEEVYDYVLYQLGALDAFLKASNMLMSHIKLHGALYMMAATRKDLANATVRAVLAYNPRLKVYALPRSELALASKNANLSVMREYFADRPYINGEVKMFGWTQDEIGNPSRIADRTLEILESQNNSITNKNHRIETVCVHSDTPNAASIIGKVRERLIQSGWCIGNKSNDTLSRIGTLSTNNN